MFTTIIYKCFKDNKYDIFILPLVHQILFVPYTSIDLYLKKPTYKNILTKPHIILNLVIGFLFHTVVASFIIMLFSKIYQTVYTYSETLSYKFSVFKISLADKQNISIKKPPHFYHVTYLYVLNETKGKSL